MESEMNLGRSAVARGSRALTTVPKPYFILGGSSSHGKVLCRMMMRAYLPYQKILQWIKKRFFCGSTGLIEQLKFRTVPAVSLICQGGIKINRGSAASQFGANRKPSSFKHIPVVTQLHSNAPLAIDVCANSSTENMLRKKATQINSGS